MQVGFIHLSVGRARGLRTDRGQLLNCVPGSVNTRPSPLVLSSSRTRKPDTLSRLGTAGGAVYDALVALAAKEHRAQPSRPGTRGHAAPMTQSASR